MQDVLSSFAYSLDYLRELVADLSEQEMVAQPSRIMNHAAWTIGHLTYSCQAIGGEIGLAPWLPDDWRARFGTGSVAMNDPSAYAPKSLAIVRLGEGQARITAAVLSLTDSQLSAPLPDERFRSVLPSVRHALTQVLVAHTALHVGQLILWRKALGKASLGRGYL